LNDQVQVAVALNVAVNLNLYLNVNEPHTRDLAHLSNRSMF
jgi:hypothetical protein